VNFWRVPPEPAVRFAKVADSDMFAEPSKLTAGAVTSPVREKDRAVTNLVAVPALPVIVVCWGCEWSEREDEFAVPTDPLAVGAFGVDVPYVTVAAL
jgi:hypothetical protein